MVLELVKFLLCDRFGCEEEDVALSASFDALNLHIDEVAELAAAVGERFGVEITDTELENFFTVEDLVGFVEDRL